MHWCNTGSQENSSSHEWAVHDIRVNIWVHANLKVRRHLKHNLEDGGVKLTVNGYDAMKHETFCVVLLAAVGKVPGQTGKI